MHLVGLIFTIIASAIISETAAHAAEVAHAVPSIDAFSALAGLGSAISLAYASLPNFRHRNRVQEHVRRRIADDELILLLYVGDKLDVSLCSHDRWGILYRLGKLREVKKAPIPGTA